MKSRYEDSQRVLWHMQDACYFLCLLSIAEEYLDEKVDLLDAARHCMEQGWMKADFFINEPTEILKYLCKAKDVKWRMVQNVGLLKDNEYSLEKWKCGVKTHFRRRYFDVYNNSTIVKDGSMMCYYVFKIYG